MKRTLLAMFSASIPLGGAAAAPPPADAELAAFFRDYLDTSFALRPSTATRLGDHRFDDRLDDVTPAARHRWSRLLEETLDALPRRVDRGALSPEGRIDCEILEHDLRRRLWLDRHFDPFVSDPRRYGDLVTRPVFSLLTQSTLPLETNVTHAIARIRAVPGVLAAARGSLANPPREQVETAIEQNRGAIRFYREGLFELAGDTAQLGELRAACEALLPELESYQEFLESDLLARSNGDWRIGRDLFHRKFELETGAGVTARENLADALAEFERVGNEMFVVARQAWAGCFPGVPVPPDDAAGRRETIARVLAHFARDHGGPDDLARDATATVAAIREFIAGADILALPEPDRCTVIEMPEFQRGNAAAYMNSPPPLDGQAAGYYAISPPLKSWDAGRVGSYLEEYNRHMLQVLTIHEAYPGHYVQMEYANRHPSLIRKVLASGTFVEGWAVYTERMMLDQGYGRGDLALRLHQLKFYLRAIANNILDYRMHCEEMTDEQALDLLVGQAFQSEGEARFKIVRAKQSSVQLSTYFTGRMALQRLRRQLQRELGDGFSLGRYHEAVLAHGSIPVRFLPELVRSRLGLPAGGQ